MPIIRLAETALIFQLESAGIASSFLGSDFDVSYLTFDGIYQKCDIWLNGDHVKRHEYGYTGLTVDPDRPAASKR